MGKIGKWSAEHDDAPPYVEYRWVHDETGQMLEVTNQKDGEWYDVEAWNRTRNGNVNWESNYGTKERARQHATNILRRYEDGQLFDPTEWSDDLSAIPVWKRDSTTIEGDHATITIYHTPFTTIDGENTSITVQHS